MKPIRPLLAAIALTAVVALVPAAPADATVLNTGTVIGGTVSFNVTPALTVLLDGAAPAPCPIAGPTVGTDVTASEGSWATAAASFSSTAPLSFSHSGGTCGLGLPSVSGAGTIGAGPATPGPRP